MNRGCDGIAVEEDIGGVECHESLRHVPGAFVVAGFAP